LCAAPTFPKARGLPHRQWRRQTLPQARTHPARNSHGGPNARRVLVYLLLGASILVGAVVALSISSYWGEVISFLSFGAAWLVAGKDLRSLQKAKEWVTEKITPSPSA
jgi:hypothetical protein